MMIAHYLASALAKFRRAPFTTATNVLTLALGLACFIAAYGIATWWRAGDAHHPGSDRIYYIAQAAFGSDEFGIVSSEPLSFVLRSSVPELEAVAVFRGGQNSSMGQAPVSAGDRETFVTGIAADEGLFDLFAFDFVEGGRDTALQAPTDVVITQETARRLFGDAPALGQPISYLGLIDFTVSAVIAPVRQPSFMGHTPESPIRFDLIQNTTLRSAEPSTRWNALVGTTLVRLPPSLSRDAFQARLDDIAARASEEVGFPIQLQARPIADLTAQLVNTRLLSQAQGLAGLSAGAILLGLGALILAVACVNYANLAAAQAEARLKETGMRKVLGAGRRALLTQHLVESALLIIPALAVAVLVTALAAPVLEATLGVRVTHFLTAEPGGVAFLIAVAVASAAAAAAWPALVAARAKSADALGAGAARTGSGALAKMLVAVQFLSASFLIIVVTAAQLQQAHLRARFTDADLQGDAVIYMDWIPGVEDLEELTSDGPRAADFELFADRLIAAPQVRSVTAIDAIPLIDPSGAIGSYARAADAAGAELTVVERSVGCDYVETMGIPLLAGRALDPDRDRGLQDLTPGELVPVVIDRRLAESLGYAAPATAVGQTLYGAGGAPQGLPQTRPPRATVVGVVETDSDRLIADLGAFGRVAGVAYQLDLSYRGAQYPAVRVDGDDIPGALAALQRVWDELQPNLPLRVRFADDLLTEAYAPFRRVAGAFVVLSVAALAISTTGLLGVAIHVAARRRREMGVRKTLGATAARLARLMLVDFSKPVLVANLLAWPLGYMAVRAYLQPFTERIALTPAPFLLSLAITLAIAWAAVLGEVLKAASVRPADVLRQA